MTRDKLVERIAKVVRETDDAPRAIAAAILADLDRAGLCIVPREPTEGMRAAGVESDDKRTGYETCAHIYRAMIAAAGEG